MNQTPTPHAEWVTVRDVADAMSLSLKTVYTRIETGDIPTSRFGRSHVIPRAWLDLALTTPPITSINWAGALAAFEETA